MDSDTTMTSAPAEAAQPAASPSPEQLLEILVDEQEDSASYRALAMMTNGQARCTLMGMSQDEARHARTAAAMYYILTGKQPAGFTYPCSRCAALCRELRLHYDAELRSAQNYADLAAASPAFADAFSGMSQDERGHAAKILALLQNCGM
jgi:rubrerythrin